MSTGALDQRMNALAKGNEIRFARAALKRRWKRIDPATARREMCEAILDPPGEFLTWRVESALMVLHYVGRAKVQAWMRESGIPLNKVMGALTERQRQELAARVEG